MGDLKDEARHDQDAGKLKEAIGDAAGNRTLETEGRIQRAEGEVTEGLNEAREEVKEAVEDARDTLKG